MDNFEERKKLLGGGSLKKGRPYVAAGLWRGAVAFSMAAMLAAQPVVATAAPIAAQAQQEAAKQEQPTGDSQENAAEETPKAESPAEEKAGETSKLAPAAKTEAKKAIASDAGNEYSLQAEIDKAAIGATVQLTADVTENITIPAGKTIVLDLNGHTLSGGTMSGKAALTNNGTVTIKDSSGSNSGRIIREDHGASGYYTIDNQGTMTVESGSVYNQTGPMPKGSSLIRNAGNKKEAKLTITGGHIKQDGFIAVKNDDHGILNITGGTIETTGEVSDHTSSAVQNWCKANITGGTINGAVWTGTWTDNLPGSVTTIDGTAKVTGKIISRQEGTGFSAAPTINIKGGTINVKDAGWQVIAPAKVAVSGGTFDSEVPANYCAEGYAPADNGDGTFGVQAKAVASVGDKAYETLADAVKNAKAGDTVKLLAPSTEKVEVNKKLNFVGTEGVVFKGDLIFQSGAKESTVKDMSFVVDADSEAKGLSASIHVLGTSDISIENSTFSIPSRLWGVCGEGVANDGESWQPNSIYIGQSSNVTVKGNTFTLGRTNEKVDGGDVESDATVAVNIAGQNVSDITLQGNTLTVTDPAAEATKDASVNFLIANGNENDDPTAFGIKGLTVTGNKMDGIKGQYGRFAGLSDVTGLTVTGNTLTNLKYGIAGSSWLGKSDVITNVTVNGNTYTNIENLPFAAEEGVFETSGVMVLSNGTYRDYSKLADAVNAAVAGSRIYLLGDNAEDVTIDKQVTVMSVIGKAATYSGCMRVTASDVKVWGLSFEIDPATSKNANSLIVSNRADGVDISGNTFTIKPGKSSLSGTADDKLTWQPNSVLLEGGATDTKISNNTFNIGQVWDESAVGVNLVGGSNAIAGTVIDGNTVATGDLYNDGKTGSMMFLVANGNTEEGYGIGTLTVTGNKVDGSVSANQSYGISIAGVDKLVATGNTLKGLAFGISFSAWGATLQKPGTDNAYYDPMPKPNGSIEISNNEFVDNTAANVYFQARNKDGKSVTLIDKASYGTGNTISMSTYKKVAPIAPTGSGMAFAGWYADESFTTPATEGTKTAYAKWVPISDVVKFMGNSFRVDNAADYSKVNMRFGYALESADGIKSIDSWSWEAGYNGKKVWDVAGINSRKPTEQEIGKGFDKDATVSNLVVEKIPLPQYGVKEFFAKVKVSYTTADGTKASLTDSSRTRTVKDLAQTIRDNSQDPTELEVANGILDKLGTTANE